MRNVFTVVTYGEKAVIERWKQNKSRENMARERGLPYYNVTRAEENSLVYGVYDMPLWMFAKTLWRRSGLPVSEISSLIKGRRLKTMGVSREYLTAVLNNKQSNVEILEQVVEILKEYVINEDVL